MNCFCGALFEKITINKNEYELCKSCGYLRKISNLSSKEEKKRMFLQSAGKIKIDAEAVKNLRERSII